MDPKLLEHPHKIGTEAFQKPRVAWIAGIFCESTESTAETVGKR